MDIIEKLNRVYKHLHPKFTNPGDPEEELCKYVQEAASMIDQVRAGGDATRLQCPVGDTIPDE